jgi:general secretion pathway protein B
MSLILDALNRAEQERSEKNHIPSLQSMHGSTEVAKRSLLQRLHLERWLIVLVVAYLLFDFFSDKPSNSPAVSAPAVVPEVQPEVAPIRKAEESVQPLPAEPPPQPVAEIESVSRNANRSEIESLYAAPPVADVDEPETAAKPKQATAVSPAVSTRVARHKTQLSGREQSYDQADDITDLSLDFRQQIPSIKYSDHFPSSQSADGRVVLNGSVRKEGDQLVPGLTVKSISEKGIVLEFQDTQFRLEAYNHWINFQ